MAIITKEIKLETTKHNLIQALIAKQNDCNSRFLKVTFLDEGTTIPLDTSSDVTINAERQDGASKSFFGVVNTDDTATVPLHSWILELEGEVNCDISIIGADSKLTTTSFVVMVEKAANSGDDISSDPQYDVLANLIEEASTKGVANALKGTASGKMVSLTDVSPLEHDIGVRLSAQAVITPLENAYLDHDTGHGDFVVTDIHYEEVYGGDVAILENGSYLCYEGGFFDSRIKVGSVIRYDESGLFLVEEIDPSTVTLYKYGKNLIDYHGSKSRRTEESVTIDESIEGLYWNGTYYFVVPISLPVGTTARFNCEMESLDPSYESTFNRYDIVHTDGSTATFNVGPGHTSHFTLSKDLAFIRPHKSNVNDRNQVKVWNLQLEIGKTATEYEPFTVESYTPNSDGTVDGVTSLYPATTLMSSADSVTIQAEYNRDINKAFQSLFNMINS